MTATVLAALGGAGEAATAPGNTVFAASVAGRRFMSETRHPEFDPLDACSSVELASVTKAFLGILLARLTLDGVVGLDEPICELLDMGLLGREWDGVTLRMLASHRGGLPKQPPTHSGPPVNPYLGWSEAKLAESIRWGFVPGARPLYSNFGPAVLALGLCRRTGRPLSELFSTYVAGPLGLDAFGRTRWTERRGYDSQGYRVPVAWSFDGMLGAGGFAAPVTDLLSVGEHAYLSEETPGGQAVRLSMEIGAVPYALGWRRHDLRPGRFVAWACGVSAGSSAFLAVCPDLGVAVAGLSNATAGAAMNQVGLNALVDVARAARGVVDEVQRVGFPRESA